MKRLANHKKIPLFIHSFLGFAFLLVACQNNHPNNTEYTCISKPCNTNGKKELLHLKNTLNYTHYIYFPANIIIASPHVKNYLKYKNIIKNLNYKITKSKIKIILNSKIRRIHQKYTIDEIAYNDAIRTKIESKITTRQLTFIIVPSAKKLNGFTYTLNQNFEYYLGLGYNLIYISDNPTIGLATFAHEIGHFFGLQHTFGSSSKQFSSKESIQGNNCNSEGDFICDTPTDYNLPIDKNCQYVGINYKNYTPPIQNFMSYSPGFCRNHFTNEQLDLMSKFARSYRKNIYF
ncbi:M43 family zinc metalloprotease [Flavobacterium oreochromis]|uniref:Peptidase M43 pregnancy-associated plasma-A domain-containing protein n=1 Tax=Flavobacterium columnare TaxID=996 RepID=A0A246GDN9_9FLAO|nr:M43 family zinc metalloprotease [Flavobacterium oreochromis]OWP74370.1 hypothetical protein BWG23_14080 [Flavobacterium oreochromis]OWP79403.1 hypothetical protein BWK62_02590 [Flavobacterium oreochromis]QYS86380.1 hypothetical protein JJC03_15960 [Flavobacterium oreochromis]